MGNLSSSVATTGHTMPEDKLKDVKEFINNENAANQVVIWSKSYCGYCRTTKSLFATYFPNIQMQMHELDRMEDGQKIQIALDQMTGQYSVPNVFVNNQHVGGNDSTQAAHANGKLADMLEKK